ncbi:MAG: UPF0147 family protein [Candidatus Burarchaeum sp.]|nr:UPF0147 family protein [Candidatus Burarchaeum sp.]MDO8339311.1 UPF0147 family protein [Candidatus Burarchaeum sp.]
MVEEKIAQIVKLMEMLVEDSSVPKNVRKAVSDARLKLQTKDEPVVRASSAVYLLNEVSEDINMPMHARTQIWTIVSALEQIRGE